MSPAERQQMIEAYAQGYSEVANALDGFPEARLSDHPLPGKWSAREIVHHLADSETESAARLRRLLTQRHPSYSAETWLQIYAAHAHGHASQIRRLRQALGG